jgi:hypothetical protein
VLRKTDAKEKAEIASMHSEKLNMVKKRVEFSEFHYEIETYEFRHVCMK